ncbi:hypothetical protein [Rhodopirellula sp. MGV]|uniref:hypothetical protein n=1 Tax=Rhodopirellula sp. MGV TaxID=2023130 RepID=UPI000B95FCFE|nr:hypothetical protein [Rhodopirellula sp. MGV]OYP34915.1 hypothetical protein CGZ80_12845 [Rhodopirellula sp. MGV]PNY38188.1 hypothetical protein C2E31_04105 [Rhodopirellula baltica]
MSVNDSAPSISEPQYANRSAIDGAFLGWCFVWAIVLSATAIGIAGTSKLDQPSKETMISLGLAVGGLAGIWSVTGTWLSLIHLPDTTANATDAIGLSPDRIEQSHGPRIQIGILWLANLTTVGFFLRQSPQLLVPLFFIVAMTITISVAVMQWTSRRIIRETRPPSPKRSIRQIMQVTTTIAIFAGAAKLLAGQFEISKGMYALVISIGALWLVMLLSMLGRYWWSSLISIPLAILQLISLSFFFSANNRNVEGDIMLFGGTVVGFYLVAFLFLALLRTSGHRWLC